MYDNYPPGAANDPTAPYNEVPMPEVDVKVATKLYKETIVFADSHTCVEYEIDPDTGGRVAYSYMETDNVKEAYEDQEDSPCIILQKCAKVCKQLMIDKHYCYAGVNISRLADSCDGWEEEELTVEEL